MLLLVNKPTGMTSHDVVDFVRKVTNIRKVGHAGTLDPMAQGLLIIGVGRESTKKLGEITKNTKKTYIAQITLGESRDTDDLEGKVIGKDDNLAKFTKKEIKGVLESFIGEQEQVPPSYSAISVAGKRAYSLARKGKEVVLAKRKVTVYRVKFIDFSNNIITSEFEVSSGTYIRAIARDIGQKLGTFSYLSSLVRTQIGDYLLTNAKTLEELRASLQISSNLVDNNS